ncbi:MAG: 60S ribosomal protein L35 [Paramarteilia canceri]
MVATKLKYADHLHVPKQDIEKSIEKVYEEISELNKTKGLNAVTKAKQMTTLRKNIARLHHASATNQREALRKFYKNKKVKPNDLKKKTTKKQRMALTQKQKTFSSVKKLRKNSKIHKPLKFVVLSN